MANFDPHLANWSTMGQFEPKPTGQLGTLPIKMDRILLISTGIRVVGKGSWKEREVGKFEVGKLR